MKYQHYQSKLLSLSTPAYLLLLFALMLVATDRIIAYVEGMILGGYVGIVATLHDERIGLAPHHMNLGNEQTIDVPRNAPADVTYKKGMW